MHRAFGYESCLRRCEVCGIGLSNANTDDPTRLTIIYRDPFATLPAWIGEGCKQVLTQALNVTNRGAKLARIASSKSEDHATWIVFRFLQQGGILGETLRRAGIGPDADSAREPTLLLWGVPVPIDDPTGVDIRSRLIAVSDRIGEAPRFRSEPDVILDCGQAGIVLTEVKCSSANERRPERYAGWDKYLGATQAFLDVQRMRTTGLYELARNWRIGWDLAEDRSLTLVNLAPAAQFAGRGGKLTLEFCKCLRQGEQRQFKMLTWADLFGAMPDYPDWLRIYAQGRGLL